MCGSDATRLDFLEKRDTAFLHHLAMPGRLHKGDALRLGEPLVLLPGRRAFDDFRGGFYFWVLQHLIHGFPLSGPESGHTERRAARNAAVATVLFHPDFNRRLRNHTESAR